MLTDDKDFFPRDCIRKFSYHDSDGLLCYFYSEEILNYLYLSSCFTRPLVDPVSSSDLDTYHFHQVVQDALKTEVQKVLTSRSEV
jgi:hypothetical protein